MKIQCYDNNTNFGVKLKTVEILEAATSTVIKSENVSGLKNIINTLSEKPLKATGHKGYRFYAMRYAEKICEKYPEIANLAMLVKNLKKANPSMKKEELYSKIEPYIKNLGEEIDIKI